MRVVQLIYGFGDGGAETLVREYALVMHRLTEVEVTVVCLYRKQTAPERLLAERGVPVIYLSDIFSGDRAKDGDKDVCGFAAARGTRFAAVHIPGETRLRILMALRRTLRRLRPDVLHYHLEITWYVRHAGLPRSVPIVYTQHSDIAYWQSRVPKETREIQRLMHCHRVQLVALNAKMCAEMNACFHVDDTVTVNNGIDQEKFRSPGKERAQVRQELGLPEGAVVIGHIGRLAAVKNHMFLLEIFQKLRERYADARLLLIGSGVMEHSLREECARRQLQDAVMFLGVRDDVNELLKAMDLMIFPSLAEGVPLTLIEAQISGLPVLASEEVAPETRISDLLEYHSLKDSADGWADRAAGLLGKDRTAQPPVYEGAERWDIHCVVSELIGLYRGLITGTEKAVKT